MIDLNLLIAAWRVVVGISLIRLSNECGRMPFMKASTTVAWISGSRVILSEIGLFAVRKSAIYDSAISTVSSLRGNLTGRNVSMI